MAMYDITAIGSATGVSDGDTISSSPDFPIATAKLPSSNRVVVAYINNSNLGYIRCYDVDPTTGSINGLGTRILGNTISAVEIVVINASYAVLFYEGSGNDGYASLINIDGSGNMTEIVNLEHDTTNGVDASGVLWDSSRILMVYGGSGNDGFAKVFTYDTGAGTLVQTSSLEFDTGNADMPQVIKLNSTKALITYSQGASVSIMRVYNIDASTSVITSAGSAFTFLAGATQKPSSLLIDGGSPMRVFATYTKASGGGAMRTFSINTSTWAVTAFGSEVTLTGNGEGLSHFNSVLVDPSTLLIAFSGTSALGTLQTVGYNSGTGALTVIDSEVMTSNGMSSMNIADMGSQKYSVTWRETQAMMQVFGVDMGNITRNYKQMIGQLQIVGGIS